MTIRVLSYDEHKRQRKAEPALRLDERKDGDARWSMARKSLINTLRAHWSIDQTEYGDGDLFVGEDWSGNKVLHVVVMKWEVLTTDFILQCLRFLVPPYDDFLITVGKSMPAVEDMFQIVVTNQRAYVCFFQKAEEEARATINAHPRYGAIKAMLM